MDLKFCSACGTPNVIKVPDGDNRERAVCPACGTIHYVNPRIVAGCLAMHDGKLLIAKRAIEPRHGFWTLPAGFLECGESVAEGAVRETWEEAQAEVDIGPLYTMISVPHIGQVHMIYLSKMRTAKHASGPESLETRLIEPADIPWSELAFPTIRLTLEHFMRDLADGTLHERPLEPHAEVIQWPPKTRG